MRTNGDNIRRARRVVADLVARHDIAVCPVDGHAELEVAADQVPLGRVVEAAAVGPDKVVSGP